MTRRLVITGTGTEVGKTIVTAAIAAVAAAAGASVTVVKPAQTGLQPADESDMDVVRRLSGVADVHELVRYEAALAPASAARVAGVTATRVAELAAQIESLPGRDVLLVEGAGGLLVRLDDDGNTIAELAQLIAADVVVVTAAGLGTLNATALTTEALRNRGVSCAGVVIGAWPSEPGLAELTNLDDLPAYSGAPLIGAVPVDAGRLSEADFLGVARRCLAPDLGGTWQQNGVDISL